MLKFMKVGSVVISHISSKRDNKVKVKTIIEHY